MTVIVRLPGPLRDLVGGAKEVEVEAVDGGTVESLLDGLAGTHPALERRVRDEQGSLRRHVNLFVNGDNTKDLDGMATRLAPSDELSILPAISGGARL